MRALATLQAANANARNTAGGERVVGGGLYAAKVGGCRGTNRSALIEVLYTPSWRHLATKHRLSEAELSPYE